MIEPRRGVLPSGVVWRRWEPPGRVRGVVLLVHGLAEHGGRYQALAEHLAGLGLAVLAPDHRGHGDSPGARAHICDFRAFLDPLSQLREIIATDYPGLPCFLLGHSLGGLIAAVYLLETRQPFTGVVLSAPALAIPDAPPAWLLALNRCLSRVLPRLRTVRLDAGLVSRDPQVVADYRADPRVHHGRLTVRLVAEMFAAMARVRAEAARLTQPLLILHGEADGLTDPAGSRDLAAGVGSDDVSLRLYPGLYHEVFNEPERAQVLADLDHWLLPRC